MRKNRNKSKKVVNFKKELRGLNKLEQLIDVITEDHNRGSMTSNQSLASNFVSSPIASILSKLKHKGKNSYCCKKDIVFTKIQNLVLKLNIHLLEKEKAILDKKERLSQSISVTLMTRSDKIVVSDLKSHELSYNELIKVVHKHTQIPLNLLSLMVGNKKIDQTSVIDLWQNQLINVHTKGFGGTGDQDAILNERICVLCGSKTAFKYLYIKTMNQEKIHVIQTMTKKTLDKDKDCVCHKCEWKAGR